VKRAEIRPGAVWARIAVCGAAVAPLVLAIACGRPGGATTQQGACDLSAADLPPASPTPLPVANVSVGATSGPITIRGHLRDASATPVVGGRIDLGGDAAAVRFSDFTGGFAFHVDPGSYTLDTGGGCSASDAPFALGGVASDVVHDFQAASTGCVTSAARSADPTGTVLALSQAGGSVGVTYVDIEDRCPGGSSCSDLTIARLEQIVSEQPTPVAWLCIAGYPAIERQVELSSSPPLCGNGCGGGQGSPYLALTTAIAVDGSVVRFESQLPGTPGADAVALVVGAGRAFTPEEIPELHGPPREAGPGFADGQ
jgi:hypothetical protein